MLTCDALSRRADHFFTMRPLRLRGEQDEVARDWTRVAEAIGVDEERLWRMRQVHGCDVAAVMSPMREPPQSDALVADDGETAVAVQVADCVPLLLADPQGRVAATHAGWRGAAANIVAATVRELEVRYGVRPAELVAAVGPSIGPCCYQVGPEVRARFLESPGALPQADAWFGPDEGDRLKLDMWRVTSEQLVAAGLDEENVHVARLCTACHVRQFYSYRVEGVGTGRLLGVIRARSRAD